MLKSGHYDYYEKLSADEAQGLVQQVQEQAESSERVAAQQKQVVERIAELSEKVSGSAEPLGGKVPYLVGYHSKAFSRSACASRFNSRVQAKVSAAAGESTEMIHENNREMQRMLDAMSDISESSKKIESIIKTIEDIAFYPAAHR